MKKMKSKYLIYGILILAVLGIFFVGYNFLNKMPGQFGGPGGFGCPDLKPGEWYPQREECNNLEMQQKCDEFCSKHPSCCPGWQQGGYGPSGTHGQTKLPLPSKKEIESLKRNYPVTIKAINEGPLIYSRGETPKIIDEDKLKKIKENGFNTVQVLLIGKRVGDKIVFDEVNNAVLLNDIVAIKKQGLAVWVALDIAGGPPAQGAKLGSYNEFKSAFMNLVNESSVLMEEYRVEYLTVNNEPDKPFNEQTDWGSQEQINKNLADFLPSTNSFARERFNGKIINKITLPRQHSESVLDASLKNVDIAGVDVGPPISDKMSLGEYKKWFDDYQFYATKANEKNIPWMNAEYWQSDFEQTNQYIKENQLKYAQISFDAYLNTTPKGAGYTWNDFSTFSWQPNGEATRQALMGFFSKLS